MSVNIPLSEEFDEQDGRFENYDSYDSAQALQLRKQAHVDIRSFVPPVPTVLTMFEIDQITIGNLDAMTMTDIEGSVTTNHLDEAWTSGVVAAQADRNHWYGLTLNCVAGANVTKSVMPDNPIDISGFATTDVISLALPSFPMASITQASSFVDFTSNSAGDFTDLANLDSVALSSSTVILGAGNSQFRFPISLLTHIETSNITGVRLRVQATGNCVFRCLAIRAIAADWVFAPMDMNTLYKRLSRPVALNGDAAAASAFPGSNWPIVWRSDTPPGIADPRPIDLKVSMVFSSGSKLDTGASDVAMLFREIGLDENTQNDMTGVYTQDDLNKYGTELETDGSVVIWTAGTLPGKRVQPDFGRSLYRPRIQSDVDTWTQADLDADTQFMIEHKEDTVTSAYLEVKLVWTNAAATLTILNADGVVYTFSGITLIGGTDYTLNVDLVAESLRARLYALDAKGYVVSLVFDSTAIVDDALVHRHKGRFGWHANLLDGDAYVKAVRLRSANFSEFVSLPHTSETPVKGAQLVTHSSPNIDLITNFGPVNGAVLTLAPTTSPRAYKVLIDGQQPLQGVRSGRMYIDNLIETEVNFDVNYPAYKLASGSRLVAILIGEFNRVIELPIPPLRGSHWEHVSFSLASFADRYQTGYYDFFIFQTGLTRTTWFIDNLRCTTRALSWDGRGQHTDAWGMSEPDWLPFLNTVDDPQGALVFAPRGDGMQIRARALKQNSTISNITVLPKYAELGNFVWPDASTTINTPRLAEGTPDVSFTTTPQGAPFDYTAGTTVYTTTATFTAINTLITFTPTIVLPAGLTALECRWDFGDGEIAYGTPPLMTSTSLLTSPTLLTSGNFDVIHTYRIAQQCQAVMRVTTSDGRRWYARRAMYLI